MTNWDIINNGTKEDKEKVLFSLLCFAKDYKVHYGLVDEFMSKEANTNFKGEVVY